MSVGGVGRWRSFFDPEKSRRRGEDQEEKEEVHGGLSNASSSFMGEKRNFIEALSN